MRRFVRFQAQAVDAFRKQQACIFDFLRRERPGRQPRQQQQVGIFPFHRRRFAVAMGRGHREPIDLLGHRMPIDAVRHLPESAGRIVITEQADAILQVPVAQHAEHNLRQSILAADDRFAGAVRAIEQFVGCAEPARRILKLAQDGLVCRAVAGEVGFNQLANAPVRGCIRQQERGQARRSEPRRRIERIDFGQQFLHPLVRVRLCMLLQPACRKPRVRQRMSVAAEQPGDPVREQSGHHWGETNEPEGTPPVPTRGVIGPLQRHWTR